jgi:hypothetical protein
VPMIASIIFIGRRKSSTKSFTFANKPESPPPTFFHQIGTVLYGTAIPNAGSVNKKREGYASFCLINDGIFFPLFCPTGQAKVNIFVLMP